MPAPTSSPRPKSRPDTASKAPTTSPRPKANPNYATSTSSAKAQAPAARDSILDRNDPKAPVAKTVVPKPVGATSANPAGVVTANPEPVIPRAPNQPTTAAPIAPNATPTPNSPKLPADAVEAQRGEKRADRTLIDAINQPTATRSAQKYKGSVLASVYKLPADGAKSAKTLQQFNGPRGQRTTLGA